MSIMQLDKQAKRTAEAGRLPLCVDLDGTLVHTDTLAEGIMSLCTDARPCAIARVMWDADKAWRDSLRAVTLADLHKSLESHLPASVRRRAAAWLEDHS